ncbi:FecR family protein [Sphingobacterium endophyticum]|uniref:FecR family protein n=1 Tax=Sphingobacterium endophyticum TaxID=2546448 RepID=UPI0012E121AB|nr:FecR family protein [Sphingobacterium endophyticum]
MKEEIKQKIELFWKGKLTVEEQKELLSKLQNDHELLFNELKKEFDARIENSEHNFSEEFYHDILQNVFEKTLIQEKPGKFRKLVSNKWAVAASIFIICAISSFVILQQINSRNSSNAVLAQNDSTILINNKDIIQIATLPDQSEIEISPNSQIAYGPQFGKSDRNIEMHGMVKFRVAHDQKLPFVVISQGYTTTALGTTFIVESYPNKKISINLLEGKVMVNAKDLKTPMTNPIYLLAGEKVEIENDEIKLIPVKKQLEKERDILKPKNLTPHPEEDKITFTDLKLEDVFSRLEQLKGVKIEFTVENNSGRTFTGEFSKTESIDEILNIICLMNELSFQHLDEKIIIQNQKTGQNNN